MSVRGALKDLHPLAGILILIGGMMLCGGFSAAISAFFFDSISETGLAYSEVTDPENSMEGSTNNLIAFKGATSIMLLGTYLLPSLIFFYLRGLSSHSIFPSWRIKPIWLLLALVSIVVVGPFTGLVNEWNQGLSFGNAEESLREMQEAAEKVYKYLLGGDSSIAILITILVMGVVPAIAEEYFFRKGIQGELHRAGLNPHVAIWLAAILFSALHMQFYGFFTRVILGASLGYLYHYSRSIWVPIIAHFFQNAMLVLFVKKLGMEETTASIPIGLASLLGTCALIWYMRSRFIKEEPEYV